MDSAEEEEEKREEEKRTPKEVLGEACAVEVGADNRHAFLLHANSELV